MRTRPRVSLESIIQEDEVPEVVDEATVLEAATRPNPELLVALSEIQDSATDVETTRNDVEELTEAGDNLEAIRAVLEGSLEDTGMDERAAAVSRLAIAQTLARVGSDLQTPSLESYTTASMRVGNTRLTLEAIGEKLKEIWAAIKAGLQQGITAIGNWLKTLFDKKAQLTNQAQKILAAANTVTGTPSGTKVKVSGAGSRLQINGQVSPSWAGQVISILDQSQAQISGISTSTEYLGLCSQLIRGIDPNDKESVTGNGITRALLGYGRGLAAMADRMKIQGGRTIDAGKALNVDTSNFDVTASQALPGNVFLYVVHPKSQDLQYAQVISGCSTGLYVADGADAPDDEIPAPSLEDIRTIAQGTIDMVTALDKNQSNWQEWVRAQGEVLSAGEFLSSRVANEESSTGAAVQALMRSIPKLVKLSRGTYEPYLQYVFRTVPVALKASGATLSLYNKQATAPATPAAPAAA